MCTAILNPHNTLPKSVFKNVLDNNPDGIGIGFSKNGKLEIHKISVTWKESTPYTVSFVRLTIRQS